MNAEPEKYGYPASNVSGIVERFHLEETIAFSRQLTSGITSFAFMIKDGPVARLLEKQLTAEAPLLSAKLIAFRKPKTLKQALSDARDLSGQADLLFVETLQGVTDSAGLPMTDLAVIPQIIRAFGKPTAGTNSYAVQGGVLSAVVKSGEEQGDRAGQMLLQAMQGTPFSELPITRNYRGKRMINVSTLRMLNLHPPALVLRGVEFVRVSTDD